MKNDKNKTQIDILEEALNAFWEKYNRRGPIKARHTEVSVKPKTFVGDHLNQQLASKLVEVYLAKVTLKHVLAGRVTISKDLIQIKDEKGAVVAEVTSKKLINKMINQATVLLGRHLAEKEMVSKSPNQIYSFGDIQEALIQYINHTEKHDSKNLVKDATVLLLKDKQLKR